MQDLNSYRYSPYRKRGRGLLVALAVAFAVLIPAGIYLARSYFYQPPQSPSTGGTQSVSGQEPTPEPSAPEEPEEPLPQSTPEEAAEPAPVGGIAESDPVDQSYFDDAVFFGDSITDGIGVYDLMSNARVIAHTGINPQSALTKQIITVPGREEQVTMIQALKDAAPDKIYIMLGANWVGENTGISEETFLSHYGKLLQRIKQDHPQSVIYVQSMFPVSRAFDSNENGKNKVGLTNEIIRTYNAAIETLAADLGVYYLDLFPVMADSEGYLPDDVTSDGMHINAQYYEKWFHYLKTHTAPAPGQGDGETGSKTDPPDTQAGTGDAQAGEGDGRAASGQEESLRPAP